MALRLDIPQDVVNTILEELYDDRASLAACALVARSFRHPCQKFLYTSISIDLSSRPTYAVRLQALYFILTNNSVLGEHVHDLSIRVPLDHITEDPQSFSTLHMLPHLRKLSIVGQSQQWSIPWNALAESLRSALYILIQSPHLHDIHLSLIHGFPTSYFARCLQLKRIFLEYVIGDSAEHSVTVEDPEEYLLTPPTPNTFPAQIGCLETLITKHSWTITPFFDALSTSHRLDSLKNLRTLYLGCMSLSHMPTCQGILDSCKRTLTSFGFVLVQGEWQSMECFPNLREMSSLRSLQIGFHLCKLSITVAWLQKFLRTLLPSVNQLEDLVIGVFPLARIYQSGWNLFDKTLAIPFLTKTHITIHIEALPPRAAALSLFTEHNFPLLASHRRVSIRAGMTYIPDL